MRDTALYTGCMVCRFGQDFEGQFQARSGFGGHSGVIEHRFGHIHGRRDIRRISGDVGQVLQLEGRLVQFEQQMNLG